MSEFENFQAFSDIRAVTSWALTQLSDYNIPKVYLADYLPPRRVWGIPRGPKMIPRTEGWHLGVLLIDIEGNIYKAGESTLVEDLPHTNHNSPYRAERRQYSDAAFRAGFPVGSVVYFDVELVSLDAEDLASSPGVIFTSGEHAYVRWRAGARNEDSVLFSDYISERIELLINPP